MHVQCSNGSLMTCINAQWLYLQECWFAVKLLQLPIVRVIMAAEVHLYSIVVHLAVHWTWGRVRPCICMFSVVACNGWRCTKCALNSWAIHIVSQYSKWDISTSHRPPSTNVDYWSVLHWYVRIHCTNCTRIPMLANQFKLITFYIMNICKCCQWLK